MLELFGLRCRLVEIALSTSLGNVNDESVERLEQLLNPVQPSPAAVVAV
jgi:hypothetical protein